MRSNGTASASRLLSALGLGCFLASIASGCGADDAGSAGPSRDAGVNVADAAPDVARGTCGNGRVEPGEDCDDGNRVSHDGCQSDCTFVCIAGPEGEAKCSDFLPCNGAEVCTSDHACTKGTALPDGRTCGDGSVCSKGECKTVPVVCGDGVQVVPSEECEDGNTSNGDGCDERCKWECVSNQRECISNNACRANGTCDMQTHVCSTGAPKPDGTACNSGGVIGGICRGGSCANKNCGNGTVEGMEECDDANTTDADGCNNDCRWTCVTSDAQRNCKLADICAGTSTCNAATHRCSAATPLPDDSDCGSNSEITKYCRTGVCRLAVCGNGQSEPKEECDDGNADDTDGCRVDCKFTCKVPQDCNDSRFCTEDVCDTTSHKCSHPAGQTGNACSDGGTSGRCKDGVCVPARCGDKIVDPGEDCDLGTDDNGKSLGCTPACQFECKSPADCSDGNACTGTETCDNVSGGRKCRDAADPPNGTVCIASPRKICLGSKCVTSSCGDQYLDTAAGEQCEPPNTATCSNTCKTPCNLSGTWGLYVETNVSWTQPVSLAAGSGSVKRWTRVERNQTGLTFSDTMTPCGLAIPEFQLNPAAGAERYNLALPDSMFDSRVLSTSSVTGDVSSSTSGATFKTLGWASLVGLTLNPATGPWPVDITTIASVDADQDGKSGITAAVRGDGAAACSTGYCYLPVESSRAVRADQIWLALREILSLSGSVKTCTEIDGTAGVTAQDVHVLGCRVFNQVPARDCTQAESQFLDANRMQFVLGTASFKMKKLSAGATCADVRAQVKP